jgi:hypothetical protein
MAVNIQKRNGVVVTFDERKICNAIRKANEAVPDEITFSNEYIDSQRRRFQVIIKNKTVCDITYKPYVDPNWPASGGDEDEFDFLLHLSNWMNEKEAKQRFIEAMTELNRHI